ncbi:MAG: hypothetical protein JO099_10150 [Acidobacteriia bacterium]|nr:hypothetical protein [Terriglobia bacterium]
MLLSAHFRAARWLAAGLLPAVLFGQNLTREGGRWVMTLTGSVPATSRLSVTTQGPVHLEGGSGNDVSYTAKLSVEARTEDDARRVLSRYSVHAASSKGRTVLVGPPVTTNLTIKVPRLKRATIQTTEGAVEAEGIDGDLEVNSGGGELKCERIRGDCDLSTAGGNIRVGEVDGDLRCRTAGGLVSVKTVRGDAVLQTAGGDVEVANAGGDVHAETAGGAIRVNNAGGSVTAGTGGGSVTVGKARGTVTIHEMAGPVQVGAAAAVRCESGSGGIRVSNIGGPMRVTTAIGSIIASLLAGANFRDSFLETGNGDVTVLIPSNFGVTIRAETDRGHVVSDFPGIRQRTVGMQILAEGALNGGGPLLRIAGTGGTIFIKRQ